MSKTDPIVISEKQVNELLRALIERFASMLPRDDVELYSFVAFIEFSQELEVGILSENFHFKTRKDVKEFVKRGLGFKHIDLRKINGITSALWAKYRSIVTGKEDPEVDGKLLVCGCYWWMILNDFYYELFELERILAFLRTM